MDIVDKIICEEINQTLLIIEAPRFKKELGPDAPDYSLRMNTWFKQLDSYGSNSWAFVTFTNIPKLGINPVNTFNTPLGIYSYPLVGGTDSGKISNFATERPYAIVFEPINKNKILVLSTYTSYNYYDDVSKLKIAFPDISDGLVLNSIEFSKKPDYPGCWIWNLTREISLRNKKRGKSTTVWNRIMFEVLGYDGVYDDDGEGIIYDDEPFQAVFFRTNTIQQLDLITKHLVPTKTGNQLKNLDYDNLKKAFKYNGRPSSQEETISDKGLQYNINQLKLLFLRVLKKETNQIKDVTISLYDLKPKNFSFDGITFSSVVFKGDSDLKPTISNCIFDNCSFESFSFKGATYENCKFKDSQFLYLSFGPDNSFINCEFNKCQFDSMIFYNQCRNTTFNECSFFGTVVNFANPVDVTLNSCEFNNWGELINYRDLKFNKETLEFLINNQHNIAFGSHFESPFTISSYLKSELLKLDPSGHIKQSLEKLKDENKQ